MKTIWKFELEITDNQEIEMPYSAEILTVQVQDETPCLWALVDPGEEKETRMFEVFETGQPIPYYLGFRKYIATVQLEDGNQVFHVFEYTGL